MLSTSNPSDSEINVAVSTTKKNLIVVSSYTTLSKLEIQQSNTDFVPHLRIPDLTGKKSIDQ